MHQWTLQRTRVQRYLVPQHSTACLLSKLSTDSNDKILTMRVLTITPALNLFYSAFGKTVALYNPKDSDQDSEVTVSSRQPFGSVKSAIPSSMKKN